MRKVPLRFTAITASHLSSPSFLAKPSRVIPALLTRTWSPPNASRAFFTTASQSAFFDTSHFTATAFPPAASISAATFAAPSSFQSATTTAAPSEASLLAVAAPMPLPAPVTTATLSLNLMATSPWKRLAPLPHARPAALQDELALLVHAVHV